MTLRQGSRGIDVKLLQFVIGTKCDGVFGPKTSGALKDWQDSYELPTSGEMTEEVWKTLIAQELEAEEHLQLARRFLFVREEDIDSDGRPDNRSWWIDVMTSYVWSWWNPQKDTIGAPWCAIFVSYICYVCYGHAFKSAKVSEWKEHLSYASDSRIVTSKDQFKKDCIYVGGWVKDDGSGHIFFVDPVASLREDSRTLVTIEGNTNDDGSRDGDGVYERFRTFSDNLFLFSISK